MNMPKRASCHRFMRRSRSAIVDVVGPFSSAWAKSGAVPNLGRAAAAPREPMMARRLTMLFRTIKPLESAGILLHCRVLSSLNGATERPNADFAIHHLLQRHTVPGNRES